MGFRSTLVTESYNIQWPEWFVEKYQDNLNIGGCLSSKRECKTYGAWKELDLDIQKAIDWELHDIEMVLVYLHECGGITRVLISEDGIKYSEPYVWKETSGITHDYCYVGSCCNVQYAL